MAYRNQYDGAYRITPKKKEEEGSPIDQYKKAFIKSLEAYDVRQKKPVRWNFFSDNEGMFELSRSIDPMVKLNDGLYRLITRAMGKEELSPSDQISTEFRKKIKERDYIEGFDEIAKGIETGKHELSLSLGELLFMGTDILANTDFQRDFQKMMDKRDRKSVV